MLTLGIRKSAVTMVLRNFSVCCMSAMLFLPGLFLAIKKEQEMGLLTIHGAAGGGFPIYPLLP